MFFLFALVCAVYAAGPPASPPWPSPLPGFPSSWFGANKKSFEFQDPTELAALRKYKQVFASWPEKVLATNFSNATLIAVEDAVSMKALLGPDTPVFAYQSQWVAAAFYPEVRVLMEDPEQFGDFFLKLPDGTFENYTGYCAQVHVSPTDYPTCIGYYWNWCNETAVDWYVNKVLRSMVASPNGKAYAFDGVFLDNMDGFNPKEAVNANCTAGDATLNVHIKTGKMFQQFGKWPVFSLGASIAETDSIWEAGVSFSHFYEYFAPTLSSIEQLYNDTERNLPTVVHAPTAVKRHGSIGLTDALASFLVATGGAPHSYFQYSTADWTVDNSWKWSPLYDKAYGTAVAPPKITTWGPNKTGVIWERKFSSGAVVTVNCTPPEMRQWCHGDISNI